MARGDNVLVLGGSSFVGRHLLKRLGPDRAVGSFRTAPLDGGLRFDALTDDLARLIPQPEDFSHAVVLLGETHPDRCVADPAWSRALNVDAVCRIIDRLVAWRIVPVFTSTEFVFDGTKGRYREDDAAKPILLYGTQKLEVERHLKGCGHRHLIVRLAKVYGDDPNDSTLFSDWLPSIERGETIRCAADQAFSPVHVDDVAEAITRGIDRDLTGLYHLSGNRRYHRVDLLELLLKAYRAVHGPAGASLEPCSIHDFSLPEPRPVDVSLVADKLAAATDMSFRDPWSTCVRLARAVNKTRHATVG